MWTDCEDRYQIRDGRISRLEVRLDPPGDDARS